MGFGSKIDNHVRMLFLKQPIHCRPIANISLDEAEIFIPHNRLQRRQISGIGQLIQAHDAVLRICLKHVKHKITANKSGAAGNDDIHVAFRSLIYNPKSQKQLLIL